MGKNKKNKGNGGVQTASAPAVATPTTLTIVVDSEAEKEQLQEYIAMADQYSLSKHEEADQYYATKKEEADALRFMDWKSWTVRPHDLRHSFCVMLRDAGVDMKLAIQWMGHADEKMILKIYDHVTDLRIRSAISSVNSLNTARASNGRQKNNRNSCKCFLCFHSHFSTPFNCAIENPQRTIRDSL